MAAQRMRVGEPVPHRTVSGLQLRLHITLGTLLASPGRKPAEHNDAIHHSSRTPLAGLVRKPFVEISNPSFARYWCWWILTDCTRPKPVIEISWLRPSECGRVFHTGHYAGPSQPASQPRFRSDAASEPDSDPASADGTVCHVGANCCEVQRVEVT